MSTIAAEIKPRKAAPKAAVSRTTSDRTARFRSKAFAQEMTAAFHGAKLRALDGDKARK